MFALENDIIVDYKYYKKSYGDVDKYKEKYCTYWSGLEVKIFPSAFVNNGRVGLTCPRIIVLNR